VQDGPAVIDGVAGVVCLHFYPFIVISLSVSHLFVVNSGPGQQLAGIQNSILTVFSLISGIFWPRVVGFSLVFFSSAYAIPA